MTGPLPRRTEPDPIDPVTVKILADRGYQASGIIHQATPRSRSKYGPRLNVPKAQRKALKEMVEKYGRAQE